MTSTDRALLIWDYTKVNELIRHLRQTQVSTEPRGLLQGELNARTVHPSLKAILDIPDTPAPRPRPGMQNSGLRATRRPAGPPAPRSWLTQRRGGSSRQSTVSDLDRHLTDRRLGSLPDTYLPDKSSLEHLALKSLPRNWEWHKIYDQYYLALLPRRSKEVLLSYIATYNEHGIDCEGLHTLFLDGSKLDGGTGSEGITHLDLGTAVGRAIKLKELKETLTKPVETSLNQEDVPEAWDENASLATPVSLARFPALTHLSLSHPNIVSWKGLLALLPHLATLTHLSLAYWPTPCVSPNSKTAYRETPAGNIDYGASNFYSFFDGDLSEAAGVLKRLSRATYCLQWLDLTGCSDWVQALGRQDGPDWFGAWRGLETVKVGQGWIPKRLRSEHFYWRELWHTPESPEVLAEREELVNWTRVEDSISSAEAGVDMIVKAARRPSTSDSNDSGRTTNVKFDRGWEEYWIKDAVEQIPVARVRGF